MGRLVHSEEVYAGAFSSTGEHQATVAGSGALYYWKFGDREPLWMTPAHTGVACSVSLSPADRTILTAGTHRTIRLWPVERQSAERHLRIEEATRRNQLSARGTHLISVRGFNNRTLRVVNLSDWKKTPLAIPGLDIRRMRLKQEAPLVG